jgi:hypothetical protein
LPAAADQGGYGRGAAVLSVGIGTTGLITFAYFSLASYSLPAADYGEITLLWSASPTATRGASAAASTCV